MDRGNEDRLLSGRPAGKRVAVVGAGIAGLASAWLLSREYEVVLFEAADYSGGHTNTVDIEVDGQVFPVDTGFLVFNRNTYPNLCALFSLLGVETVESEMSFGVSLSTPELEWAGSDLGSLFAQRSNLARPAFWGMLGDIRRFNRETTRMAHSGNIPDLALGDYLATHGYGQAFRDWYLIPMAAAIWSCPTRTMMAYPLATFVRFCHNHGLLKVLNRPQWYTVKNGARTYVRQLIAGIGEVRRSTPVLGVVRDGNTGVQVQTRCGVEHFDEIVFACHPDQTLRILGAGATDDERAVLGAVKYQDNEAWLHTDTRLLPRRRKVWSAWNYLAGHGAPGEMPVSVSYLLNRLQPLPVTTPVVLSLNPLAEPAAGSVLDHFTYAHPVFDQAAIDAQARLPALQGQRCSWFAGAWTGYGFHEDGLKSALVVANAFGVSAPWQGGLRRQEVAA
ncbi:MAG: NAD(P)-binding protein [Zoogloea oleivorans]|jgi:predicted NAD/FAD-binding protein|uniref:NAD(P)/FAD-dependent oxidoreductase n=1 Tax=Zoogloea oleivorans TaxID=1552750 RepID=UPI002A35FF1F|nr:FAD-dependent oxidoreductase [Zoogloea oleivorans]MDY0035966.1 NAD(P)-binding protein [Zoogloea oleivorans]